MENTTSSLSSSSCSSPSSCGGGGGRIGYLSRILRRILCFSNLPLCSFENFREEERESSGPVGAPDPLNVVARLMGLDSVPVPRVKLVEEANTNLANQFKTSYSPQKRHYRDIPRYHELQDDKFYILSFEKRRHRKLKSLERKNKENENPESLLPPSKKKLAKKVDESSENSSPNSVLEFVGYSADQESVSSGEMANSKTRRPLSEELESCGDSESNQEGENLVIKRREQLNYAEIGRMAAVDIVRSSWFTNTNCNKHFLLEIGRDVASCIFDHLLEELDLELRVRVRSTY